MKPPGKTTLDRMRQAAADEASRIEIVQDALVSGGNLTEPDARMVRLRDDFAGIVRVFDKIMSDALLLERLQK